MGIFNNNFEIDTDNPFNNDQLRREDEVKSLTSVFEILDNQIVLAINSKWGTGKTTFLKMWNQYLKNEGYKTIFFNAWENDYVEEPFIAFVDEIRESVNDENKIRGFMEKAKDVGLALAKQSPKMVSKVIKNKTGFDSEELVSDDELTGMISEKIDNYNKNKKSVNKFKKELGKVALKEFEQNSKPMIIFVDELDRCRPDYAICLLERIKHFFNVQNIIFILGIDKEALTNSIRVIYGEQTDINGYLTRFIDFEYKLKQGSNTQYVKYLFGKYKFNLIFEKRNFRDTLSEEYNYYDFIEVVEQVAVGFNLSLRDIEKLIIEIYMIIKANIKRYVYPYPLIMLCAIKRINKDVYNKIKFKQISYSETVLMLKQHSEGLQVWLEDRKTCVFKAYLMWLLNDITEINRLKEIMDKLEENKRWEDKDVMCVQDYDRIVTGKVYWMVRDDGTRIKEKIFEMVELYDNFTLIGQ